MQYYIDKTSLLTPDLLYLSLKAKSESDFFSFTPGQYAAISFYKNFHWSPKRSFSFANSAIEKGVLEFGIRIVGDFTQSLAKLRIGDQVDVQGPFGEFTLKPSDKEVVFFAGGIGITPFLSMIRTANNQGWPQKITILYSVKTTNDAAYGNELLELQAKSNNFRCFVFLSKEDATKYKNPQIISGQITPDQISLALQNNFQNKRYFLCGPAPFMAAMQKNLLGFGVAQNNILTEDFSSNGNTTAELSPQTVVNRWIFATVLVLFFVIATVDAVNYSAKINPVQTQTQSASSDDSAVVPSTDSSSTSSTSTDSSSNSSSVNTNSTTNNSSTNSNSYTPPRTRTS